MKNSKTAKWTALLGSLTLALQGCNETQKNSAADYLTGWVPGTTMYTDFSSEPVVIKGVEFGNIIAHYVGVSFMDVNRNFIYKPKARVADLQLINQTPVTNGK